MFGSTGDGGQVVSGLGRLVVLASYSVTPWTTQSPLVAPPGSWKGRNKDRTEQSKQPTSPLQGLRVCEKAGRPFGRESLGC